MGVVRDCRKSRRVEILEALMILLAGTQFVTEDTG